MARGKRFLNRYGHWLLGLVFLLTLVPMLVISIYDHPAADDYSYGLYVHQALEQGGSVPGALWQLISNYYVGWQGTFSAIALMGLTPQAFSENLYFLVPFIMLAMLIAATIKLSYTLICRVLRLEGRYVWLTALPILFLQIQFLPSAVQSLFWWNGSVYYTFFYGVMLFWLDRMVNLLLADTRKGRLLGGIPAGILAFLIGGSNYVTALLTAILSAGAIVWCIWQGRRKDAQAAQRAGAKWQLLWAIVSMAAVLTGLLISAMAPGNAVRQANLTSMGPHQAILYALAYAAKDCLDSLSKPVLLVFLLLLPLFWSMARQVRFRFRWPAVFVIGLFLVFAAQNTPHFYAASTAGPERLRNIIYFSYIWMLALDAFYVLGWIRRRWGEKVPAKGIRVYTAVAALGLLVVLVLPSTYAASTAGKSLDSLLDGTAAQYDAQLDARLPAYLDETQPDVTVAPLTVHPEVLYFDDMGPDMNYWQNQALANYYGKTSVSLGG